VRVRLTREASEILEDVVLVVGVLHGARDPKSWISRG
jgi:hypothetical protein